MKYVRFNFTFGSVVADEVYVFADEVSDEDIALYFEDWKENLIKDNECGSCVPIEELSACSTRRAMDYCEQQGFLYVGDYISSTKTNEEILAGTVE